MKGTMIFTLIDGHGESRLLSNISAIKIAVGNFDYRIKVLDEGDGIQLSVDSQLVVYPKASNLVFLKGEPHGT